MSKFTTEVRYICEESAGVIESVGFNSLNSILEGATDPNNTNRVFNFDYPFTEKLNTPTLNYKRELEKKILRHYYTREIGEESVGLWKLRLCDRLNMIMPYYNQLYDSTLIKFDPLINISKITNGTENKKNDGFSVNNETYDREENKSSDSIKNKIDINKKDSTVNEIKNDSYNKIGNESYIESSTKNEDKEKNDSNISHNVNNENSVINENSSKTPNLTTTVTDGGSVSRNSTDKYSDTPQSSIANLENDTYLTNARIVDEVTSYTNKTQTNVQTGSEQNNSINNNIKRSDSDNIENGSVKENNRYDEISSSENVDKSEENKNSIRSGQTKDDSTNEKIENDNIVERGTGKTNTNKTKNETFNGIEDFVNTELGKSGSMTYSKMLIEFRDTILNIDKLIIDNLSDLFFMLWE